MNFWPFRLILQQRQGRDCTRFRAHPVQRKGPFHALEIDLHSYPLANIIRIACFSEVLWWSLIGRAARFSYLIWARCWICRRHMPPSADAIVVLLRLIAGMGPPFAVLLHAATATARKRVRGAADKMVSLMVMTDSPSHSRNRRTNFSKNHYKPHVTSFFSFYKWI